MKDIRIFIYFIFPCNQICPLSFPLTYLVFTLPGELNLAIFMLLMYCFVTLLSNLGPNPPSLIYFKFNKYILYSTYRQELQILLRLTYCLPCKHKITTFINILVINIHYDQGQSNFDGGYFFLSTHCIYIYIYIYVYLYICYIYILYLKLNSSNQNVLLVARVHSIFQRIPSYRKF